MSILTILISALSALVFVVLLLAALKPNEMRIERSATIKAAPERIFELINDFHGWSKWSPWDKIEPAMQRTYDGESAGEGARYAWVGDKVGSGSMEILSATAASHIKIKLDFIKPFEGHNITEFSLEPDGDSTKVTWLMHGPSAFVSKIMSVFVNMDQMIGKDFEKGLVDLKLVTERAHS